MGICSWRVWWEGPAFTLDPVSLSCRKMEWYCVAHGLGCILGEGMLGQWPGCVCTPFPHFPCVTRALLSEGSGGCPLCMLAVPRHTPHSHHLTTPQCVWPVDANVCM